MIPHLEGLGKKKTISWGGDLYVLNDSSVVVYNSCKGNMRYVLYAHYFYIGYCFMFQKNIIPPSEEALGTICHYLIRLQEVDSPLEKLENLLTAISAIFNSVSRL